MALGARQEAGAGTKVAIPLYMPPTFRYTPANKLLPPDRRGPARLTVVTIHDVGGVDLGSRGTSTSHLESRRLRPIHIEQGVGFCRGQLGLPEVVLGGKRLSERARRGRLRTSQSDVREMYDWRGPELQIPRPLASDAR